MFCIFESLEEAKVCDEKEKEMRTMGASLYIPHGRNQSVRLATHASYRSWTPSQHRLGSS